MKKIFILILSLALIIGTAGMASAFSHYDVATSDWEEDWISTSTSGPDTSSIYRLLLPDWYDSTQVTLFDLVLTGHGDNSSSTIDPYVSFDDGINWISVGTGFNAPGGTSFTYTFDLLGDAAIFDGYDFFDVAYGCHFYHDKTGVSIQDKQVPVPEPATLLLLGTGLAGLAGFKRRRQKKN